MKDLTQAKDKQVNILVLTWRPAKYMNDLSLKCSPNIRNRKDIGISKKKGT